MKLSKPYDIVSTFEESVAEYAGSYYGIAVDSCTNALFLACKYFNVKEVKLPKFTYVGVAYAILNAGGTIKFIDHKWEGSYILHPYQIVDSARRFRKNMYMYMPGTLYCVSFHWSKHLPIGRGGMILTNDYQAVQWLKKARFDGRTEGVLAKEDNFTTPGYHMYMIPELAARGLMLMNSVKDDNDDLPWDDYSDLSKHKIFQGENK